MNQTNSTFEAMLKAAISRDATGGATDTMLIHAHLAQMKMFGIRQGVEFYPAQDNFGQQRYDFIQQVIKFNQLDATALPASENSNLSLSINANEVPFYLRGYKAIEKEMALISARTEEQILLLSAEYLNMRNDIAQIENDVSSSQLRGALPILESDKIEDWIIYNSNFMTKAKQGSATLILALSAFLGGAFGGLYVLIMNMARKRKTAMNEA